MITERQLAHKINSQIEKFGFDNLSATKFCTGIQCENCPKKHNDEFDCGSCCHFCQQAVAKYGKHARSYDGFEWKNLMATWAREQLIGNKLALI